MKLTPETVFFFFLKVFFHSVEWYCEVRWVLKCWHGTVKVLLCKTAELLMNHSWWHCSLDRSSSQQLHNYCCWIINVLIGFFTNIKNNNISIPIATWSAALRKRPALPWQASRRLVFHIFLHLSLVFSSNAHIFISVQLCTDTTLSSLFCEQLCVCVCHETVKVFSSSKVVQSHTLPQSVKIL